VKKFTAILNILMSQDQLDLIINNSDWDEDKREWKVPNFVYRERNVGLPKLQQGRDFNEEREKKEVVFRNSKRDQFTEKRDESFQVNQIVRGARDNY
jgi:hypothetical protein